MHPMAGAQFRFSQYADEHSPERPVLLAVDQQLGEGAALRVGPELADPVGSLEVGSIRTGAARRGEPARGRRGGLGAGARRLHVHEDWTLAPDGGMSHPSMHLTLDGLA